MEFEEINMSQRTLVENIRKKYNHYLSSHAFSSLYIWKDKMKLKGMLSDQLFCIKRQDYGSNHYFYPCGDSHASIQLITDLISQGTVNFHYVREEDKLFLEQHFPKCFRFISSRDDWEYMYLKDAQIQLNGGKFRHIRSKVNRGRKLHDWTVFKLTADYKKDAKEIIRRWSENKTDSADIQAAFQALDNFEALKLSGVILKENQTPLAFAIGTAITEDTFDLHISKTVEGNIDCYLKWELYQNLDNRIKYINREEDLGITGLRTNKTDMMPIRFNKVWRAVSY